MPLPPLVLAAFPFVKGFIDHQEAHAVAQIEQLGIRRIVAGADRVAARFFQLFKAPSPYVFRHGGAQRARVVVEADAFQLPARPIEEETFIRVKAEGADTCFDEHLILEITVRAVSACF